MKKAFTLAEMLIVLAIIAVIALLIMPTLKNMMPDKKSVYFRKAYSGLTQAVYEVTNNAFLYPQSSLNQPILTQRNTASGVGSILGVDDSKLNDDTFFCYAVKSLMNLSNDTTNSGSCESNYNFETADGTRIYGLNGAFSTFSGGAFEKPIYIRVMAKDDATVKNSYSDSDYSSSSKDNKLFRVYINANGQVIVKDETEKELITNIKATSKSTTK